MIPSLESLTAPWLTDCLRSNGCGDVVVSAVRSRPIGTGQTAGCARIEIDYAAGAPAAPRSLVAKYPSADAQSRGTAVAMGLHRREVEFYRDVAPRLSIRLPHCYFLDVDDAGENFLILMEDLAPARPGDQLAGCSAAVARAAVLELVGLQAPTWCDATLGARFAEPEDGVFSDMAGLYRRMLPEFVARYGAALDAAELDVIERLGDSPRAPLFAPVGRPFCLEHRDYRLDNLMIDESCTPPRVTVVDWQGMRTGRPLNDVALCLAGGLEPEVRRQVEQDVLRDYHRALLAAGVAGFSWDACWHEYRRAAFAGFGLTVIASVAVARTERGDAMFIAMARRYARHAVDLRADELLR
ncbi:MAG: phosphotransferase [Pseudomonadales bacterium]